MVENEDWNKKIKAYQRKFRKHGVSPKALRWRDQTSVSKRFAAIVKELNFEWKTILDVGCGFGELYTYLAERFDKFEYTGIDMVKEFIVSASAVKQKTPGETKATFECRNFFEEPVSGKYEVVVCSGVLNSSFKKPDEFRRKAILRLFETAQKAVVFNMAGGYPQPENKEGSSIYYSDSMEILKYCHRLSTKVTYNHSYLPKDFTVAIYR